MSPTLQLVCSSSSRLWTFSPTGFRSGESPISPPWYCDLESWVLSLIHIFRPGIARKSILQLAREKGMTVEERPIAVEELFQAHAEGRLTEAFGTGTAAVISPVGELAYRDRSMICLLYTSTTPPCASP